MAVARHKAPRSKKEQQAETARAKICEATIVCLDRYGYADTSINRVQEVAGVSRGALTHHFPSKQALVAATTNRLLERALTPRLPRPAPGTDGHDDPVAAFLLAGWNRMIDTKEGRALVEILVATRTDPDLHSELAAALLEWDRLISEAILTVFASVNGDDEDVKVLWSICRTFLRGLLIHGRFTRDPAMLQTYMKRFAELVSPHLKPRA